MMSPVSSAADTIDGFTRFIESAVLQRRAGTNACFAVTVDSVDAANRDFSPRRAGQEGVELVMEFAFDALSLRRLEARAAVQNGRGNAALRKLGAVRPLRGSLLRSDDYLDEFLWTILDEDSRQAKVIWGGTEPLQ